jgi:DUF1680 family protein
MRAHHRGTEVTEEYGRIFTTEARRTDGHFVGYRCIDLIAIAFICIPWTASAAGEAGTMAFATPSGAVSSASAFGARFAFGGPVGERIERNIDGWLIPTPLANPGMTEMFRARDRKPPPNVVPWAGEFAGKFLTSAALALRMTEREDLRRTLEAFVGDLLDGQAEDGYLGPFPKAERLLGNWDLWGHYHVVLGLLLWSEETGDARAAKAAERIGDLICATFLGTGRRALDAGSPEMNLAPIHGLGMLYRRTGAERYLRMMREIEKDWERAGDYFRQGLAGVDFYRTPRPRWESLHDVQGLVELYRITGDRRYRAAFESLWRSIRLRDRHNDGGFSSGEQAVGHPYSPAAIETCCTIAWMALTADYLRLTGDPAAADELELSTLNGMLGAQHPSGRWWTYSTPMDGAREASAHAIVFQARAGTPELNCCSVNGPRGLGMLSEWAVLAAPDGVALNWYGPLKASLRLADGTAFAIEEETEYPRSGRVGIVLRPERKAEFTLRLRIPAWSRETRVSGPDGPVGDVRPGTYLALRRSWSPGDRVDLELDLRLRLWGGDREQAGKVSVYRGPILLAWDQSLNGFDEDAIPALDARALAGASLEPGPRRAGPLEPWLAVRVRGAKDEEIVLCDFASAGARGTRYRSWLPSANPPPPPVVLESPRDGEAVPSSAAFSWARRGRRTDVEYEFALEDAGGAVVQTSEGRVRRAAVGGLQAGREYRWRVTARNGSGVEESEARRFRVDPSLPPARPPAEPGPGGLLIEAPLRGDPAPARGALVDAAGVAPAAGPAGEPGGALAFDGEKGRVRYAVDEFPSRNYSVSIRAAVRALPEGRIAQVASAWAGSMDDPLRITIDGGKVSARIEAEGRVFATEGVPVRLGEWMRVAAVKSGTVLILYIDGEERARAAVPEEVVSEAAAVGLGGNPNFGGNEFLRADLAEFRFWARALSPEEIRKK